MKIVYIILLFIAIINTSVYGLLQSNCQISTDVTACQYQYPSSLQSTCPNITSCLSWISSTLKIRPALSLAVINLLPTNTQDCPGIVTLPEIDEIQFNGTASSTSFLCDSSRFIAFSTGYKTDLTFNNIIFNGGGKQIDIDGAGIYAIFTNPNNFTDPEEFPTITFNKVTVNSFQVYKNGGFLYSDAHNLMAYSSKFSNCVSNLDGGVFKVNGDVQTVSLVQSTFTNNLASGDGSVAWGNNFPNISNSKFNSNKAYNNGGVIYANNTLYVTDSSFKLNQAASTNKGGGRGGAIYYGGVTPAEIYYTTFYANGASSYGGSIYATNVKLYYSVVTNGLAGYGGAVACSTYDLVIYNSTINMNSGTCGIVYSAGKNVYMDRLIISQNSIHNGTLYFEENVVVASITNSEITSNMGDFGCAVFANGPTSLLFYGSEISYNTATYQAGGLMYANGFPSKFIVGGVWGWNSCMRCPKKYSTFSQITDPSIRIVNVQGSLINDLDYYVPIVTDNGGNYARAYGVSGLECYNGYANITDHGVVNNCKCFNGYTGSTCDTQSSKLSISIL